jgi:hypothetical protein
MQKPYPVLQDTQMLRLPFRVYVTPSEELTIAAVNKADKIIYQAK